MKKRWYLAATAAALIAAATAYVAFGHDDDAFTAKYHLIRQGMNPKRQCSVSANQMASGQSRSPGVTALLRKQLLKGGRRLPKPWWQRILRKVGLN